MRKLALIFLILLIPALALGQAQTTGRVSGNVVDENGQPVVGAIVTVESPALLGERQARTNERGEFLFGLLPVGPYRVVVSAPGKKTMDFSFPLTLGQTVPLNVTMIEGQDLVEVVNVLGTQTRMETTANGENFNLNTMVEELPLNDRRIEELAFNAPNVTPGPNSTPSIAGAPSFDTTVLLDGAEISDPNFGGAPTLYIEDAVEEVQVLTSGISARYGRFQGGVLNAITKTGGNEFTASVRLEYENDDWNSQTPHDAGLPQADDLSWTAMGTVGGYVMKDRLWFFLAGWYQPSTSESDSVGIDSWTRSYTSETEQERYQYKMRGAIAPEHVLDVNYLEYDQTTSNYEAFPAGDLLGLGLRSDPREVYTAAYQGVLNDSLFVDAQWSKKDVSIASGGDPTGGIPYWEATQDLTYHNHWFDASDPSIRNNETFGAALTYNFVSESYGAHTLEGGFQMLESETGGENRQSPVGFALLDWVESVFSRLDENGNPRYNILSVADGGDYELWEALPLGGSAFINYDAFYVQDSWEIGSWRVDAGLRWEQYDNEGPLPVQTVDFNDISPRLGVTYNIDNDWQVMATWGKYVARLHDGQINNSTGVDSAPMIIYVDYVGPTIMDADGATIDAAISNTDNWATVAGYTSPVFPTTVVDPDLGAPYAQDLNLAVKRALPNNTGTVSLTYTRRVFKDLLDDFTGGDYQNIIDVEFDGTLFGSFDQKVWTNNPDAIREYDGIVLTVDYRPNTTWSIGGNYTWSRTWGNYEGEGVGQPGNGSVLGDYPNSIPMATAAPTGYLQGDTPHRARLWGNYRFDFSRYGSLTLGGLLRFSSGTPYSLARNVRVWNDDPAALDDLSERYPHFFDSTRGAHRFNSSWALDFSARYQVQVYKDLSAWVKLSAVNILDRDELISHNTSIIVDTNDDGVPIGYSLGSRFGQSISAGDYQNPREWLLTVGASWK